MKRAFAIALILFLNWGVVISQNWEVPGRNEKSALVEEITRMNRMDTCQLNFEVRSYSSHSSTLVEDAEVGVLKRIGSKSWSKLLGIETYNNGRILVTVDAEDRKIVLADVFEEDIARMSGIWETYLNKEAEISILKKEGMRLVRIKLPAESGYDRLELTLQENGVILKSTLYYGFEVAKDSTDPKSPKDKPRIEFEIKDRKKLEPGEYSFWTTSHILMVEGSVVKLTDAYKNFEIVDTRFRQNK